MKGQFYTDITRDTFKSSRHFSRVLMQQGRVQLDADWNEQQEILLHHMRTFAADVLGPHAGPDDGFKIVPRADVKPKEGDTDDEKDKKKGKKKSPLKPQSTVYEFVVTKGHYYVDGILSENDEKQYSYSIPAAMRSKDQATYLLYLDVWEHEVTYLENDQIREVALGGPDTATRSEILWQVKTMVVDPAGIKDQLTAEDRCLDPTKENIDWTCWLRSYFRVNHGYMKARTIEPEEATTDLCITPPSSQFRGEENQLYRVEIHHGGDAWPELAGGQGSQPEASKDYATFKWSRENGSIVFPIVSSVGPGTISAGSTITVTVEGLGRDESRFTLQEDDWVELVNIEDMREGSAGPLLQVQTVDHIDMQVTLLTNEEVAFDTGSQASKKQFLRRWDQHEGDPDQKGAIELADDGAAMLLENRWLTLENGVQILFHRDKEQGQKKDEDKDLDDTPPKYHLGDYWLIPTRTATGRIEWPGKGHAHYALQPHGVEHHYAPLTLVTLDSSGNVAKDSSGKEMISDLRRQIVEAWKTV